MEPIRAQTYEERASRAPKQPEGWSEDIVPGLFHAMPEIRRTLNADVVAAFEGDPAAKSIEEGRVQLPGGRAITAYRIAHFLHEQGVPMIRASSPSTRHSETADIHPARKQARASSSIARGS